jgi:hypothetical protein
MRSIPLVTGSLGCSTVALLVILTIAGCGQSGANNVSAPNRGRIYSLVSRDNRASLRLFENDPHSLAPIREVAELPGRLEGAGTVRAFSPDGWELVLASDILTNGRPKTALTFIDLRRLRVRAQMILSDPLSQLVWLAPNRLLAFAAANPASSRTRDLPLHVIDPTHGQLVRTTMVPPLNKVRSTSRWVVGTFARAGDHTTRIARIDVDGKVRTTNSGIQGGTAFVRFRGVKYAAIREAGLAISSDEEWAYVVGPRQDAVEVHLRSLVISRHRLHPPLLGDRKIEATSVHAVTLGRNVFALSGGRTTFPLSAKRAPQSHSFGLRLVDTRNWTVKTVDPSVDTAPVAADKAWVVFLFGRAVGFNLDGTQRFDTRDARFDPNGSAFACGRYVYFWSVRSSRMHHDSPALVLDTTSGRESGQMHLIGTDLLWLDSPCKSAR